VSFAAPPGLLQLKLAVLDADGAILERDVRRISVPDYTAPQLAVSSPVILRARTALELRSLLADPDAAPFIGREFRRTDRVLVRFEVYGARAAGAKIAARLRTRAGGTLVALPVATIAERGPLSDRSAALARRAGEFTITIGQRVRRGSAVNCALENCQGDNSQSANLQLPNR
jgi:hypothetical protein